MVFPEPSIKVIKRTVRTVFIPFFFTFIDLILVLVSCSDSDAFQLPKSEKCHEDSQQIELVKKIQFSFTIRNRTTRLVRKPEFWVYGPVKQTANQKCQTIVSSHPYTLMTDNLGNQILRYDLIDFPPFSSRIITIQADLLFSSSLRQPYPLKINNSVSFVPCKDASFDQLIQELRGETPCESAAKILSWISENVRYSGYMRNDRGFCFPFKKLEGDCTEFSNLFVIMAQSIGIPACRMAGFRFDDGFRLKPENYHNWAEFFEGDRWAFVDPQRGKFKTDISSCVAMLITEWDGQDSGQPVNQFGLSTDDLEVKMND